jgi:hypothetical protein
VIATNHPSFKHPADSAIKIWRYMDLSKFVALLLNRALHFCRADALGDPFEGSITKVQYELRNYITANRHADPRLVEWRSIPDDALQQIFEAQARGNRFILANLFVNCWHMNEHESAAMWRLYSQSQEAVCVQSRFNRLAKTLPAEVFAGEVKYIDYESDVFPRGNAFNALMHKRLSFSHERELRAVVILPPESARAPDPPLFKRTVNGCTIDVDVQNLIEAVYVSPTAAAWFKEIVEQLIAAQGMKMPVRQSSLSATPLF